MTDDETVCGPIREMMDEIGESGAYGCSATYRALILRLCDSFEKLERRIVELEADRLAYRTRAEYAERELASLKAALAEKTAECARLLNIGKKFEADFRSHFEQSCRNLDRAEKAEAALAESQAREAKLRELCKLAAAQFALPVEHGAGAPLEVSRSLLAEIRAALALKADNAALREVCERVAREAFTFHPANSTPPLDTDIKTIVVRVLGAAK